MLLGSQMLLKAFKRRLRGNIIIFYSFMRKEVERDMLVSSSHYPVIGCMGMVKS